MSGEMCEEENFYDDFMEEDDDEDEELDLDGETTSCIFCERTFEGCEDTWAHCAKEHGFPLSMFKQNGLLDCFTYIKIINYIRQQKPSAEKLKELLKSGKNPWSGDEFMKPVLAEDPLLMFDIDEALDKMEIGSSQEQAENDPALLAAKDEVRQLQEKLQEALEDLQKMRIAAQQLVMTSSSQASRPGPSSSSDIAVEEDQAYFGSYSHFGIHQEMLQDKVRTESYKKSIELNAEMFKDKVVLDVGCGTGILSMFAARAGAKKVIGVDMSDVIYQAIDVVRENGLEDKITLMRGKMEEIELPVEQVDIIISEWMGYFLLFESMLDTVIYARDRYLSPEGHVLPNRSTIWLQGLEDQDLKERHITFWHDVYGFKMSSMKSAVLSEASVQTVKADKLVTNAVCLKELDHKTCSVKDLDFTSPFKLECNKTCDLMAFVAYFLCDFNSMNVEVQLSTSPCETSTHWKQTVFFLEESIHLESGEILEGQLICRKNPKDPRSLKIVISCKGKTYKYVME